MSALALYQHPVLPDYEFCYHWESRLARAQLWRTTRHLPRDAAALTNYGVTLPGRGDVIHVHLARDYVTARHAAHEVVGHGLQVYDMGDVDYLATYGWHFVIRAGSHTAHMMEQQARGREARYTPLFVPTFTRAMERAGLSPLAYPLPVLS
jgi:hypothetical protein